jgi:regulator of nucleoside diphosphate kinase
LPSPAGFAFVLFFSETDMTRYNELLVSASDAETLARIVGEPGHAAEGEALADLLMDARMVARERLPGDRAAMNSRVTYREEPGGATRSVVIVHPRDADASAGRISVLSPVGRALLGRKTGAVAPLLVPGGRALTVRLLRVADKPVAEAT